MEYSNILFLEYSNISQYIKCAYFSCYTQPRDEKSRTSVLRSQKELDAIVRAQCFGHKKLSHSSRGEGNKFYGLTGTCGQLKLHDGWPWPHRDRQIFSATCGVFINRSCVRRNIVFTRSESVVCAASWEALIDFPCVRNVRSLACELFLFSWFSPTIILYATCSLIITTSLPESLTHFFIWTSNQDNIIQNHPKSVEAQTVLSNQGLLQRRHTWHQNTADITFQTQLFMIHLLKVFITKRIQEYSYAGLQYNSHAWINIKNKDIWVILRCSTVLCRWLITSSLIHFLNTS